MRFGLRNFLTGVLAAIWLAFSVSPATVASAQGKESEESHEADEEPAGHTTHVGCDQVLSEANREALEHGRSPKLSVLAKRLGTSGTWVERCLQSYGRRSTRSGYESAEGRENRLELLESEEVEETFPEDAEEPGASERPIHPEKERQFKINPIPTPSDLEKEIGASENEKKR